MLDFYPQLRYTGRMQDTEFHRLAKATLATLADTLEAAYEAGALDDLTQGDGVLTVTTDAGVVFVVSKHAPTQQIWLASPIAGGLHFSYSAERSDFCLADGRTVAEVLYANLAEYGILVGDDKNLE